MIKQLLAALLAFVAAAAFAAVDVNKATQAELESVKGIGPAIAGKILDERKKSTFKDWNDLVTRVQGVGDGNAAKFSEAGLTVGGAAFKGAAAAPAAKKEAAAAAPAKAAAPAAAPAAATAAAPAKAADKAVAKADPKADKEAAKKAKDEEKAKAKADKDAAKKAKADEKAKADKAGKPAAAAAAASAPKK